MELLTEYVIISGNTATLQQTLCCLQEQTTSVDVKQHLINLDELINSVNELQKFKNIKTLFLCKLLPPRSDHAVINRKVSDYNDLMSQHFADNEYRIVIDTVSLERDLFYKDGLHLSDTSLTKLCGIILSSLFKKFAPHLRRRSRSTSGADGSTRFNDVDQSDDVSGSLMLGCLNLQYYRAVQSYFKSIFDCFDVVGISEHSLFQEQLDLIKAVIGNTYNCHAASAFDNPAVVSGKIAHGGVALLTPLETIDSVRIVGIKCDFPNYSHVY